MSEMVERVAKALWAALDKQDYTGDYNFPHGSGTETTLDGKFDLREVVRVVIEVMKEPPLLIVLAGWDGMIDRALKEG